MSTEEIKPDQKLFDNIFRFVALCVTSEEYHNYISDGLIKLDLDLVRQEYESKNYHPKQIKKILERREKELIRIHANRKKFFSDFVKRFNQPPYDKLVDSYIDKLHESLKDITVKDANS